MPAYLKSYYDKRRRKTMREVNEERGIQGVFDVASTLAAPPTIGAFKGVGAVVKGLKFVQKYKKVKKIYDTATAPPPPRKTTIADKMMNGSSTVPMPKPAKPSRPAPPPPQPQPQPPQMTQAARQNRRQRFRGY